MNDTYYPVTKEIDILGIHSFYYQVNTADFYLKDYKINCWSVVYVDSGAVSVSSANRSYFLSEGDIVFFEPFEVHSIASLGKDLNRILIVRFNAEGNGMERLRNKVFTLDHYQRDLINHISKEASFSFGIENSLLTLKEPNEAFGSFQMTACLLERLFIDTIRNAKEHTSVKSSSSAKKYIELVLVQSIQDYMSEHTADNLSLNNICVKFNIGKSYLSAIFKENTGSSVMEGYNMIKMQKAKELLQEGFNVTQTCVALGFSSINHFTRSFKAKMGCSPSDVRRQKADNV